MNLIWLAAVLQPRDVARHPNFSDSTVPVTPVERLAAAVIGGAWLHPLRDDHAQEQPGLPDEAELVALAEGTLRPDSIAASVSTLAQRLHDGAVPDPAQAAALALMTCCAAAELDDYGTCFAVLDAVTHRLRDREDDDGRLVRAAVLQQRALRLRDAGRPHVDMAVAAGRLALAVDASRCTAFATGLGVDWGSQETCEHIRAALIDAAAAGVPMEQETAALEAGLPDWQARVKAPSTEFAQRSTAMRADAYAGYVRDVFDRQYRTGARTIGGSQPSDLFHAALAHELLGHPAATRSRREVVLLRLVQPYPDLAQDRDVIRLLRHAAARTDLDLVLRRFRTAGPLTALSADARQILSARTAAPELLRSVELQVLQVAADLLAPAEARRGLDAVRAVLAAGGPSDLPGEWQLLLLRKEQAWRAAAALANACDAQTEAADLLLAEAGAAAADELADRYVAGAVRVVEWGRVAPAAAAAWAIWIAQHGDAFPATAETVRDALNLVDPAAEGDGTLGAIVSRLNAAIHGTATAPAMGPQASEIVRRSLARVIAEAGRGISHLGGLEPADVAAGMITVAGATDLWPELATLLTDPAVRQAHKARAFERLGRAARLAVPDTQAAAFRRASGALLRPDRDPFEPQSPSPYPPALRFLAVHRLLPDPEVMDLIAALAGSHEPAARAEAARTVAAVAAVSPRPELLVLALSLAHDDDVAARSHAGRALASLSSLSSPLAAVADRRLSDLLREDGLLAPTLLLGALADVSGRLPPAVREQVAALGTDHPSREVRAAAVTLLQRPPRAPDEEL